MFNFRVFRHYYLIFGVIHELIYALLTTHLPIRESGSFMVSSVDDVSTPNSFIDLDSENPSETVEEMAFENSRYSELDRGCPGLDYLGVGYDSIYANSLGDEDSTHDPGYRAPIIEFTWRKNSQGYSPTLRSLYPVGGWVRPVFSCSRSSKINEIHTIEDLKSVLSLGAKLTGDLSSNVFSGSFGYKNIASNLKSRQQRVYVHSDRCIRYQAGIPLNISWEFTDLFKDSVKKLPLLKKQDEKNCSVNDIKEGSIEEKCQSITAWINFFEMFGTHFTHQLTLGGKVTQIMKFDAKSLSDLKKSGVNVELEVEGQLGSGSASLNAATGNDKSQLEDICSKKVLVVGGQMPDLPLTDENFAFWGNSVADNPMPIGVSAQSIKQLLEPNLHTSFEIALLRYAKINGITYETLKLINGTSGGLMKEIRNSEDRISWSDSYRQNTCPEGSKILLGVSFLFQEHGKFIGMVPCQSKSRICTTVQDDSINSFISWMICTSGLQPALVHLSALSGDKDKEISVKCPKSTVIQLGISITAAEGKIISLNACKYGSWDCTTNVTPGTISSIWAVCYTKGNTLDIKIETKLSTGDSSIDCGENSSIIAGYGLKVVKMNENKGNYKPQFVPGVPCQKLSRSCNIKCKYDCIQSMIFAICQSNSNRIETKL